MTDGKNNPSEPPEDDWAMTEPDADLKGEELEIELPIEDRQESLPGNVSNLYDPLETGDLEGWEISSEDIAPEDIAPENIAPENLAPAAAESPVDQSPPIFQDPPNAIEIIEPEKPHIPVDNWEMKPAPPPDGWKMPEPEFRTSEGKTNQNAGNFPAAGAVSAGAASPNLPLEVDENLSDIYAPPDTEESFDDVVGDIELTESEDTTFEPEDFTEESEDFAEIPEPETDPAEQTSEIPAKKRKGKTFVFLSVVFLLVSIFVITLLGAAYFFYFDQLKAIFGI